MTMRFARPQVWPVTLITLTGLVLPTSATAQTSAAGVSGGYSQDFNSLITAGSAATLPAGIPEWAFDETGTCDTNPDYDADDGGSNTGDTYSYGTGVATDRALGALASGNCTTRIGARFDNNTGQTINQLAVNFNCEHWRQANGVSTLAFEYKVANGCSITDATWVAVTGLNCNQTSTGTSSTALDGNAIRTAIAATITGLSIANGDDFCIRWSNADVTSNDDGLGIDDFSLNPQGPLALRLDKFSGRSEPQGLTPALMVLVASLAMAALARQWGLPRRA